jgi:hypothetical protein
VQIKLSNFIELEWFCSHRRNSHSHQQILTWTKSHPAFQSNTPFMPQERPIKWTHQISQNVGCPAQAMHRVQTYSSPSSCAYGKIPPKGLAFSMDTSSPIPWAQQRQSTQTYPKRGEHEMLAKKKNNENLPVFLDACSLRLRLSDWTSSLVVISGVGARSILIASFICRGLVGTMRAFGLIPNAFN